MSKNRELVNELKSESSNRRNFFKEKIKEELKKNNMEINDTIINDIFNNALDTYTDDVKIPFLFHIKAVIKNKDKKTETGYLNKLQYEVIKLYLTKENNKYLSKIDIATKLSIKIDEVIDIIESLNNDNNLDKIFPNYKEILKDRNDYFKKKAVVISEKQIILLVEYCGGLKKEMDFKALAKKYDKTTIDIKNELKNIFKLLKTENNLTILLDRYPNIKNALIRKSKVFNISLDIKEDIAVKHIVTSDFKRKAHLNKDDITMLKLLDSYNKNEITCEKIKEAGFDSVASFVDKRNRFFSKLRTNKNFFDTVNELYPNLGIETLIDMPRLTYYEFKALALVDEYSYKKVIEDEKLIEEDVFKNIKSFNSILKNAINKLNESVYLLEKVSLVLTNLNDLELVDNKKKKDDLSLSLIELKILETLNDNPNLTNRELAAIAGFKSEASFVNRKYALLARINNNKILELNIKRKYPHIVLLKEKRKTKLSDKNIELLTLLEKKLSDKEMADTLELANEKSYYTVKRILFKQLEENESLKRDALRKFPDLILDDYIKNLAIRFTENEIVFLQEFCLIEDNNLIYQSEEEILKKLNLQPKMIEFVKTTSTIKVVKNMIVGTNLDELLWSNFTDEFITRDSFNGDNSISVNNLEFKEQMSDDILEGIKRLEESIFGDFVGQCTLKEKLVLALRLGYFDKRFFTSSEVAMITKMEEIKVISLTKECLKMSRNNYIEEKQKQKILI